MCSDEPKRFPKDLTILLVANPEYLPCLNTVLKTTNCNLILHSDKKTAAHCVNTTHLDAVVATNYLGPNSPQGGMELLSLVKRHRRRYGGSEYPVSILIAAWNASLEEKVLHEEATLTGYNRLDILRHLQTALKMAESANTGLPWYEITVESLFPTDRLCKGCQVISVFLHWGPHHVNITPPSVESLLLLICLLMRRNHPVDLETITDIHNNVPFYYEYLGVSRYWTYDSTKMRYTRLMGFLKRKLGTRLANRILKNENLEDQKRAALRAVGKSVKFVFRVVKNKDRT